MGASQRSRVNGPIFIFVTGTIHTIMLYVSSNFACSPEASKRGGGQAGVEPPPPPLFDKGAEPPKIGGCHEECTCIKY